MYNCTVPFVLSNLLYIVHVCSTHFTVIPVHLFIKKQINTHIVTVLKKKDNKFKSEILIQFCGILNLAPS